MNCEEEIIMTVGQILALVGAAIAVILSGMGSSKGVGLAGETAAGVSSENPEVSSRLLFRNSSGEGFRRQHAHDRSAARNVR